jgi:hypothetical protein
VNEGNLGDFPWSWQSGTNFNAQTYTWLNSLFNYQDNAYIGTNGAALTTSYFNVLNSISYTLDAADAAKLNKENLAAAATINTLILEQISLFGPMPSTLTTQNAQLIYIALEIMGFGNSGLTLGIFRNSTNPMALLPNIPLGADQLVADFLTYLAQTSSVANIQNAVISANNQLAQARNNTVPASQPTSVTPGFMQTVNSLGATQIVPAVTIAESVANIQNNLLPTSGGMSFSSTFTATASSTSDISISCASGSAAGLSSFFLSFGGSNSTQATLFSADSQLTTCQVTLTYNGCTTVTPIFSSYNVSTGTGWWDPEPIEEAANPTANQSGYQFTPTPAFDFGVNGNFGALARVLISQQPIIKLVYSTSNSSLLQKTFSQQSSWGCSFLGISFGGGSKSYYQCTTTADSSANTFTVTMSPVGISTPITAASQLATVIGAGMNWPGASTAQNKAAI